MSCSVKLSMKKVFLSSGPAWPLAIFDTPRLNEAVVHFG